MSLLVISKGKYLQANTLFMLAMEQEMLLFIITGSEEQANTIIDQQHSLTLFINLLLNKVSFNVLLSNTQK